MTILKQAHEIARKILKEKEADALLGLTGNRAPIRPALFKTVKEIDNLVLDPKILLAKIALKILKLSTPGFKLAVMCRGCDERALVELVKMNQISLNSLVIVGVVCTGEQAEACLCRHPYPTRPSIGKKSCGVDPYSDIDMGVLTGGNPKTRQERWTVLLQKCIKCYGCRNACPLCVCDSCRLEDSNWVLSGDIPPEPLAFHLIRVFHLADRCVACGACQEACPSEIPLLALHLSLRRALEERYGYEAGRNINRKSPLLADFTQEPEKGRDLPEWENSLEERTASRKNCLR